MPISFYVKSGDDFLDSTMWIPNRSRGEGLVFCHGWGGQTQYDDLLEKLASEGYYALRFQQRGYEKSTGKGDLSLWSFDMATCAATLKGVVNKVWAGGQSTGGTIALIAATTYECFAGAISLAPFCSLEGIIRDNANARGILEEHFGPLEDKHYKAADALRIVQALHKPVLLIHGAEDQTVPFKHGLLLVEQLGSNVRFVPVPNGNHHLKNIDRSFIIGEVITWLEKA